MNKRYLREKMTEALELRGLKINDAFQVETKRYRVVGFLPPSTWHACVVAEDCASPERDWKQFSLFVVQKGKIE